MKRALALALVAALSTTTALAGAEGQTAAQKSAQALFDDGMRLFKAGKVAEACPKLAESQAIDPGMATQFRLAECYEKLGKPALAWTNFREVAEQAHREKMADREEVARKRAEAVAATMPKLSIVVSPAAAAIEGLTILRDGAALRRDQWGAPIPVEPGEHSVSATAPGRKDWASKRAVTAGATIELSVPVLEAAVAESKNEKASPAPSDEKRRPGPALGIALGAGAVAGLGAGVALFMVSKGKESSARDLASAIGRGGCARTVPDARCAELDDAAHGADTFHNAAVGVLVGAGALAVGSGASLLWSAMKGPRSGKPEDLHPALRAVPLVGVSGGGLMVSGDF